MGFADFLSDGSVKKGSPDMGLAKGLVRIMLQRMKNLEKEIITDDNSFQIVENCYEAIREGVDSLMAAKGYKSYSHEANIDFLKAFYYPELDTPTINKIDRYRKIRNDIKYRGLLTTKTEAETCIAETKQIISKLLALAKKAKILD